MKGSNPFAIPSACWVLEFTVHKDIVDAVEEAFNDVSLGVSSTELDEKKALWQIEVIVEKPPSEQEQIARVALVAELTGHAVAAPVVRLVDKNDWVSNIAKSFPPLRVGQFFVHGSHYAESLPPSSIPLHVDAGMAFGSGEHATTSGCLLAIGMLAKRRKFVRALDMGCGSGILAIGAAKQWKKIVTATDIDPVSVQVSHDNARINRVSKLIKTAVQDGFRGRLTQSTQHYDLIIANILARPLVSMAKAMKANLQPGGVVVLSGLLNTQENMVLHAYRQQGLYLKQRFVKQGWSALVLS